MIFVGLRRREVLAFDELETAIKLAFSGSSGNWKLTRKHSGLNGSGKSTSEEVLYGVRDLLRMRHGDGAAFSGFVT